MTACLSYRLIWRRKRSSMRLHVDSMSAASQRGLMIDPSTR